MIYIGTDIVDVNRIRQIINKKKERFLKKIFTDNEIKYCQLKIDSPIHFSGRFAAKEAVKKALLSSGFSKKISMKKIEVLSSENGPKVNIYSSDKIINLSISHTKNHAIATAILEKIV